MQRPTGVDSRRCRCRPSACAMTRPGSRAGTHRHTLGWCGRINAPGAAWLTPSNLDGRWMCGFPLARNDAAAHVERRGNRAQRRPPAEARPRHARPSARERSACDTNRRCVRVRHSYSALAAPLLRAGRRRPGRGSKLVIFQWRLADELGSTPTSSSGKAQMLSGNRLPEDSSRLRWCMQDPFGGFVPQLGDGRAILLGELTGRDGGVRDVQLKGPA